MKNYIICILLVLSLVLSSLLYKHHIIGNDFLEINPPVEEKFEKKPKLFLYVVFSRNNCRDCLEIIEVLNSLSSDQFFVKGFIPDNELAEVEKIRAITGAIFPIEGVGKLKGRMSRYTPSIYGASKKGDLFFIMPGVPGEKEYLKNLLISFYQKIYPFLLTL